MIVEIKGKTYNGSVKVYDRFTLPQVELVESALLDNPIPDDKGMVRKTNIDKPKLPALFACVQEWNIDGMPDVTIDTFPLTPRSETHELIEQIFSAIHKVYNGEMEVPNE